MHNEMLPCVVQSQTLQLIETLAVLEQGPWTATESKREKSFSCSDTCLACFHLNLCISVLASCNDIASVLKILLKNSFF